MKITNMNSIKPFLLALLTVTLLSNCADDPAEDFLWANWLATSVVWHDCDIITDNGPVNCGNNLTNCVSCLKLNLNFDGKYTLTNALNGTTVTETGTYKTKGRALELNPVLGDTYELPIDKSSPTILVIEFPGDDNCVATITMEPTDCP